MMEYPTPTLNALVDGCVMDMRVKFAMELLKTPGFVKFAHAMPATAHVDHQPAVSFSPAPDMAAAFALDMADELYAQALQRGWIRPLPENSDIPPAELAHVERQAAANVHGQLHAQKVASAERPMVMQNGGLFHS